MKLVIYGMAARDAAALTHLVGKEFSGWTCDAREAQTPWALPAADAYVLDVAGMGAARCTEALAEQLMQASGQVPALLVTLAHDTSWSECALFKTREAHVRVIRKPYGAEAMRVALREVFQKRAPAGSASEGPRRRATDHATAPGGAPVATANSEDVSTLSVADFGRWVAAFPATAPRVFFRKLAPALAAGRPFEICLTLQHSVIVFPDEHWVATNTPMAVILRLCKSDALASVATIRAVDAEGVMKRVGGLGMNIEPLEPFLWNLHAEAEPAAALQRQAR